MIIRSTNWNTRAGKAKHNTYIHGIKLKYMIITNDMRAVIIRMQRTKVDPNYISPNLVADVARDMGKELTSEQIVYISDNY
jgi:hypothetical protein